jgi:hypothetical protein
MNCVEVKPFYNLLTIILQRNEGLPDTAGGVSCSSFNVPPVIEIGCFLFIVSIVKNPLSQFD